MSLFYAYLKDSQHDNVWRYPITFADSETADEWWRMISTRPSPYAGRVTRVNPQFYTHDGQEAKIANEFFSNKQFPGAKEFLGKMFFTLLHDRDSRVLSIAPPIKVTDNVSGHWYFIRSCADPQRHWYFRIDGDCLVCGEECEIIHVSTKYRTRFCIQTRNVGLKDSQSSNNLVLIGRDDVSIAASKEYNLHINDADELQATKSFGRNSDLLFSDLKNRFVTRARKEDNGVICECIVPVERGLGEPWELLD